MGPRVFVWMGGALFVASLTFCVYIYVFRWADPRWPTLELNAAAIDLALFTLFAMHHSVFAREPVKARLARVVRPDLIRSFYVWITSVLFIVVCSAWRPVGGEMFAATGIAVWVHAAIQLGGIAMIARSVATIDPLELAGIRQGTAGGAVQ